MSAWLDTRAFRCPCGQTTCAAPRAPAEALLAKLDLLHYLLQRPLVLVGGLRCAAHHAALGGDPESGHLDGTAADIAIASPKERWHLLAAVFGSDPPLFHGVGLGPAWLHVSLAPSRSAWLAEGPH